ncbi:hypothetical protein LIER_28308 [Lithospermum erythrorhizon]|uniref:Uncharacterized protein n=1 Tax=Lithospermum erythrorhizon TaxID=34254 RepID=A0AAV3RI71_LITER
MYKKNTHRVYCECELQRRENIHQVAASEYVWLAPLQYCCSIAIGYVSSQDSPQSVPGCLPTNDNISKLDASGLESNHHVESPLLVSPIQVLRMHNFSASAPQDWVIRQEYSFFPMKSGSDLESV